MAVKISDLPIITTATDDDYLPMVDPSSGQTRRILKSDLLKELRSGADLDIGAVKANKADFSVADATARLALASPFEGLKCYQKDVDAEYIYDGSTWRRQAQWEQLADVTLGSAAASISSGSISARTNLRVIFIGIPTSTIAHKIQFNNDTANNYSCNQKSNDTAQSLIASTSSIQWNINSTAVASYTEFNILNISTIEKLVSLYGLDTGSSGAAASSNRILGGGKWVNTSAQITRIDFLTTVGTYASGTRMIVEGKN